MYPKQQLIIHKLLMIILTSFHVRCSPPSWPPTTEEPPSILSDNATSTVYITTTTTTTAKTTTTVTTAKGFQNPNVPSGKLTFEKLADFLLVKNLTNQNNNQNNNSTNSSHQPQPPSTMSTILEPYFYINGHPVVQLSNLTMEHFSHPLFGDINNATTTTTTTTSKTTTTTPPSTTVPSSSSINDCVDGRTYWNDRLQSCQTCMKQCPKGAMIQRSCNRSNNLECVCAKGYYMSIVDGTCKPCSECPSGYGVWRTCRWSRNTVCRQCQPGTYSGVSVGTLGCIPCSKCGPNQEMISGCDGDHDTVCIDRSSLMDSYLNSIDDGQMPPSTYFSNGIGQQQQQQQQSSSSSATSNTPNFDRIITTTYPNGHGLPFYIALLVAIVFAFCLYALIQLRCNHSLMITNHHRSNTDPMMMVNGHHSKLSKNVNLRSTECGSPLACPIHNSYTVPASWMATLAQRPDHHWLPYQSSGSPVSTDSVMPLFSSNDHQPPPPKQHHNNNNMHNKMTRKFHKPSSAKYKTYYELLLGPNTTVNHSHHNTTTTTNNAAAPPNIGQQNGGGKPTNNNNNNNKTAESMQSIPLISDDVEHLTIEIRQALESLLGKDTETWRLLARELGYDEQHIVQFEAKSATISNGHTIFDTFKSIRLLLLDWSSQMTTSPDDQSRQPDLSSNCTAAASSTLSSSSSPSLATLTNALIRIGRVDCARIVVRQNHAKQTPPTTSCSSSLSASMRQ